MRMKRVRAKKASRTAAKPPRSPRCFPQIKLPGCFPDHPMPGRSCYPRTRSPTMTCWASSKI